jgi:hypothetical protein
MDPNCLVYGRRGSRSAAFDDALIIIIKLAQEAFLLLR